MSLEASKIVPFSSKGLQKISPPERKSTCMGRLMQWVRASERGSTASKIGIYFLQFIATVLLFASIVGIPLFLALRKERIYQEMEAKNAAISQQPPPQEPGPTKVQKKISQVKANLELLQKKSLPLQDRLAPLRKEVHEKEEELLGIEPKVLQETEKQRCLNDTLAVFSEDIQILEKEARIARGRVSLEEKRRSVLIDDLSKQNAFRILERENLKMKVNEKLSLRHAIKNFAANKFQELNDQEIRIQSLKEQISRKKAEIEEFKASQQIANDPAEV